MTQVVFVIAGMTLVTYIPRLLPLITRSRRGLSARQTRMLQLVPVTAIGALIVPGGVTSVGGRIDLSLIGIAAAAILALLVRHPFLVVVGSVGVVALALALGL